MKKLRYPAAIMCSLAACFFFDMLAFAEEGERVFTEEDRLIFGLLPLWAVLLIAAGMVMAVIVILVEVFKRKMK